VIIVDVKKLKKRLWTPL